MKRSWVIWEIVAWTVFFPVALVLTARRMLGYGYASPDGRVAALLRWYPEAWRERHGDGLREVLHDTIEHDRDGLRVSLDVAREGVIERARVFDPRTAVAAAMLTVGWIMVLPQGIIAAVFLAVDGPRSWFLAQYLESPQSWLVIAAMIAGGLALIDRSLYGLSRRPVENR
ncbi:MAG TPA: hypothetical protein VEX67_05465 [Solirubrobacteraceae bacterium]|nr:hypothetical protein [Solirubrobacteraceae bacterium]